MGKFSLANLFGITLRESANDGSDFTNPDADYRRVFLGEDGQLHAKDSAGAVTDLGGDAGVAPWAVIPDAGVQPIASLAFSSSNLGIIVPVTILSGVEVTGVRIRVSTASGNISCALYDEALGRLATSGAVACPAAGSSFQSVAFSAAYTAAAGRYWLAMSCDNTSAIFDHASLSGLALFGSKSMAAAHPLPATFVPSASFGRVPVIVGMITGGWAP